MEQNILDGVKLKDGRYMTIRLAEPHDVSRIAAAHPLPRKIALPEAPCRAYYEIKSRVYTSVATAGIVTGWVHEELAGFVFFCANLKQLRRAFLSPRLAWWCIVCALQGRLGWHPLLWAYYVRWAIQHIREKPSKLTWLGEDEGLPEATGWIGTVHTVERFRRLGVATRLMERAEWELAQQGAMHAALWVATDNLGALRLYERRCYQKVAVAQRIGEQCWLMVKRLPVNRSAD